MIQDRLIPVNLEQEMKKSFISYAMAVIIDRALPDVRDGLKPVHRRILYDRNEVVSSTTIPILNGLCVFCQSCVSFSCSNFSCCLIAIHRGNSINRSDSISKLQVHCCLITFTSSCILFQNEV